jgi:acetyl esterase
VTELDEAARRLVDGARVPPFLYEIGAGDARQALDLMQAPPADPADLTRRVVTVPTPHGPVRVHVLTPVAAAPQPRPMIVYVHGGGWVIGGYETHHRLAVSLCRGTGAVVVVPEYARAPEARFPVAVEQLTAVLAWLRAGSQPRSSESGIPGDRSRIALVGDCAGATMALSLALADRGACEPPAALDSPQPAAVDSPPPLAALGSPPPLAALALLYPLGRPRSDDPSAREFATGAALRLADVRRLFQSYSPTDPRADPLAAGDLADLPPTLLVTAEADVTRDHAERFGARLRKAGVAVTAVRYLGTVHDFAVLDALRWTPTARAVVAQVNDHLRAAFDDDSPWG